MKINFNKAPSNSDEIGGLKVNYAPAKRPFAKWRFNLVLLLFLLPFISYLAYSIYNYVIISAPGFVLLKDLKIKTPSDGIIKMIKPVGSDIVKGEVIAVLQNKLLEAKYKNYSEKLEHNSKNLKETIQNNRELLKITKNTYDSKYAEYKRLKKLREQKLITEHVLSNAVVQLNGAMLAFTNAKESLENAKLSFKEILSDELEVKELKEQLDSLVIMSPVRGIVTDDIAKEGELVQKYDELLVMDLHSKPVMEIFLNPKYAKHVKVGKKVKVVFPDNTKIDAEVSSIHVRAVKTPFGFNTSFKKVPYSIVLELKLEKRFPMRFMINYLPIKVTFYHLKPLT